MSSRRGGVVAGMAGLLPVPPLRPTPTHQPPAGAPKYAPGHAAHCTASRHIRRAEEKVGLDYIMPNN